MFAFEDTLTLISEASLCYPFGEAAEAVFRPPRNTDIVLFSAKESWVMLYGVAELYKMKNAGNWFVGSWRPFFNLRLAIYVLNSESKYNVNPGGRG